MRGPIWPAIIACNLDLIPFSPRAKGVLFVLKGPYDPRVPPIVKFSQESESARVTKIIMSKSTVKTLQILVGSTVKIANRNFKYCV